MPAGKRPSETEINDSHISKSLNNECLIRKNLKKCRGPYPLHFFLINLYITIPIIVPEITEANVAPNNSFKANFETC
jgi:hypothetical protein